MVGISIVLIIANMLLLFHIYRSKKVHAFLKIIWGVSYLGWGALPLILIMTPLYTEMISVPISYYLFYANINQVSLFLMNLWAYYLIRNCQIPKLFIKADFQDKRSFNYAMFWICSLILMLIIFRLIVTPLGYQERNDLSMMSTDLTLGVYTLLEDFSVFILLAQILWKRNVIGKKMKISSEILLSLYVLMQIYNGRRIYLFFFVLVLLYISYKENKKKWALYALFMGGVAMWLLPIIADLRQEGKVNMDNIIESKGGTLNDITNQVVLKTNSVQYSCYLLMHDGIGQMGPKLYTSTIYALIPRFIYPNKPVPGSVDGTLNGIPARLNAFYHRDNYNDIENNGITSSLEALWALGWPMFFLQTLIVGYVIFLFNGISFGGKPMFVYFMFSLIGFPVCVIDVSLVKIFLNIQRYILIYLIFKFCFK